MFEYRKYNGRHWDGAKLYKQVVGKVLAITEALYLGYSLLFLFNNTTSHLIYTNNTLQVQKLNKSIVDK